MTVFTASPEDIDLMGAQCEGNETSLPSASPSVVKAAGMTSASAAAPTSTASTFTPTARLNRGGGCMFDRWVSGGGVSRFVLIEWGSRVAISWRNSTESTIFSNLAVPFFKTCKTSRREKTPFVSERYELWIILEVLYLRALDDSYNRRTQ